MSTTSLHCANNDYPVARADDVERPVLPAADALTHHPGQRRREKSTRADQRHTKTRI